MKQSSVKSKRLVRRQKYPTSVMHGDGSIPLPVEVIRGWKLKSGDKFAVWQRGDELVLQFPKGQREKAAIPANAYWGKVEGSRKSSTILRLRKDAVKQIAGKRRDARHSKSSKH